MGAEAGRGQVDRYWHTLLGVPVVTQDEDYVEVPGLKIVRV
jgi:hypothetical protein